MALQQTISRDQNNVRAHFPDGYHRILSVNLDKGSNQVQIRVAGYADEAARRYEGVKDQAHPVPMPVPHGGGVEICSHHFSYPLPADMPEDLVAWAYEKVKLEEAFQGSADV
jgi:hypothetical protein